MTADQAVSKYTDGSFCTNIAGKKGKAMFTINVYSCENITMLFYDGSGAM